METLRDKILLLRHEQRPDDPSFDTLLTGEGVARSRSIPTKLSSYTDKLSVIYSSPFLRCLETVQPVLEKSLSVPLNPENCLSEWFVSSDQEKGVKGLRELTKEEANLYQVNTSYKSLLTPDQVPMEESIPQLDSRVHLFLDHLAESYQNSDSNTTILIVTHQSIIESILKYFKLTFQDEIEMGCLLGLSPLQLITG